MKTTAWAILFLATITYSQQSTRPEVTATLCQGWSKDVTPEGPTREFATDNASLRIVLRSEQAFPAGHTIKPFVAQEIDGKLRAVLRGAEFKTDGKANAWGTGFKLAGETWAAKGGTFRFLVYWDDEEAPLVDERFTVRAAKRWALLVGISDYPPAGRNAGDGDLPACDKDALKMRDLLVGSFGFQPSNIRMLLNLDGTAARIQKELIDLAAEAGPNDVVVFYYVGHGTQIPDLDGDEPDGWDEALATADVRPKLMTTEEQLALVLSDDRIAELLARFKTKNVTVIFDSCHSGTAVRAGEADPEIDADGFFKGMKRELGFGRKLIEKAEDADRSKATGVAEGLDIDQRYVFLSAARSWETGMTDANGCFFSRTLRSNLRNSNGKSWEEMMRIVRPVVQLSNPGQAPQADGAVRRYPFSLTEAPRDAQYERPTVAVVGGIDPKNPAAILGGAKKGQVALVSGMASLYLESGGVVYDAYPGGLGGMGSQLRGRVRLTGKVQVIQRSNASPLAYASAEVIEGTVHRGDRLVPRTTRVPEATPLVGITFLRNVTASGKQRMQGAVNALVQLLKSDATVRLLLTGSISQVDYIVVPQIQDGKVIASVFTPTSQRIGTVAGDSNSIAKAVRDLVVTRHDGYARFNRISNPSPAYRLRVVAEGGEGPRPAGASIKCKGYVDRPAYVYAFLTPHGGMPTVVVASDKRLVPNQPFDFNVSVNPNYKGRAQVKVIASEKQLDIGQFQKAAADQRAAALLRVLQQAYPAVAGGSDFIGTDGWAETTVWFKFK